MKTFHSRSGSICNMVFSGKYLTTILILYLNISDHVICLLACISSSPEQIEVSKHEWYHVVKNYLGHVFSESGLPKVAKNCQKMPKVNFYDFPSLRLGCNKRPATSAIILNL